MAGSEQDTRRQLTFDLRDHIWKDYFLRKRGLDHDVMHVAEPEVKDVVIQRRSVTLTLSVDITFYLPPEEED